uniref:NADH-ubiquinone oxidoreductase chain 3 n=1 Tax=Undinula vulgaris TaxID=184747 RepID=A0A6B9D6B1_UNDVU|nr:NADH dehydrogenase subunit 3 [Undinula vulgaris]
MLLIMSTITIILGIIVLLLGSLLSKKLVFDREKMSPFECGFTPKFNARLPFTLRFFLISIIFLVFDVELVLMFPFLMSLNFYNNIITITLISLFLLILILGLTHEWNQGSLEWAS